MVKDEYGRQLQLGVPYSFQFACTLFSRFVSEKLSYNFGIFTPNIHNFAPVL